MHTHRSSPHAASARSERLTWQEWMARLAAQRAPVGLPEMPRHSIAVLANLRASAATY
jgi:hypothetical protein